MSLGDLIAFASPPGLFLEELQILLMASSGANQQLRHLESSLQKVRVNFVQAHMKYPVSGIHHNCMKRSLRVSF